MAQQPELALQHRPAGMPAITAQPRCRDHAMAGYEDRHGILAAGIADRPGPAAQRSGQLAIGPDLAPGNTPQRCPDTLLESGSAGCDRNAERV